MMTTIIGLRSLVQHLFDTITFNLFQKLFQPTEQMKKNSDKDKVKMKKKKKRHKQDGVKVYENDCYRCGDGGELIMCDKGSCPKVYHLKCLKLAKLPTGE